MKNVSTLKSSSAESPKTPGGISRSLLTPCRRVGLSRNFKKSGSSPFQSPLSSNIELKQVTEETKKRKKSLEETPQTPGNNDDQGEPPEVVQTPTRRVELPRRKKSKTLLVSINKNGQENDSSISTDMNVSLVEKHCNKSLFQSQDPGDLEQNINNETVSTPVHTNSLCIKSRSKKNISPLKESTIIDLERKKSKTLIVSINNNGQENDSQTSTDKNVSPVERHFKKRLFQSQDPGDLEQNINNGTVSTPVHINSLCIKSRSKKNISPLKESTIIDLEKENLHNNPISLHKFDESKKNIDEQVKTKQKSPNNLTKECIVVIQKKIYNKELNDILQTSKPKQQHKGKNKETASQVLFDSDSDDVPLICLNNKTVELHNINEEDDFTINKAIIAKPDYTDAGKTKSTKSIKSKYKVTAKDVNAELHKPPISQSSIDDDDDEFFEKKKTILIRKSYNKITKPQKAKSTGSITQKDIDDIKARIETKKKMLLARANMEDTKELKDLIKKWQKGCQEALMQLMDLMKNKMPDKQNMDYSEMLQTLKIPASLVGYDSDNECFLTPDDESIILANVQV